MKNQQAMKSLGKWIKGMQLITHSVMSFSNEKEQKAIEQVFNGEHEEGYAYEKYFFQHSFDEEVDSLVDFIETWGAINRC